LFKGHFAILRHSDPLLKSHSYKSVDLFISMCDWISHKHLTQSKDKE